MAIENLLLPLSGLKFPSCFLIPLFVKTVNSPKPQNPCFQRCSNKHKHQAFFALRYCRYLFLAAFLYPRCRPSDGGLTVIHGKKLSREEPFSLLTQDLSALFQQQIRDLYILLARRRETLRMELAQRSKTFFSQQLAAAVESGVSKQLKAKDEEMERVRKLNWVLEDKLGSAFAENQIWREFVGTNEVTTNLLRTKLEQILRKQ